MNRPEKIIALTQLFSAIRHGFDDITLLKKVLQNGETDILAEAVKLYSAEDESKAQWRFACIYAASCISSFYSDYGFKKPPTKKQILERLSQNPKFLAAIPRSKRGLTDWWKEVDCMIEQQREW